MKFKITALIVIVIVGAVFYWQYRLPKEDVDLLIINGRLVTMDPDLSELGPGWIAVKGDTIVEIGEGAPKKYKAKQLINVQGGIVMPGLVNTHSHAAMTKLAGVGEGLAFGDWLKAIEAKEAQFTEADVYQGTKQAIARMVASGTTTFNDMYFFPESAIKAVKESGIRAVIRIPISKENGRLKFNDSLVENHPRLTFSLAPNPLLDFSPQELKQVSDHALQKNLLVHVHFDEDAEARRASLAKYGLTPYQVLEQSGLLRNKLVLAHGGDLNNEEIEKLANYSNISVSYNPISEKNLQTPLSPIEKLIQGNVRVALGTDGEPSSDLDMFEQMKFAGQDFPDFVKILQMVTLDAAKALAMENQIGSLESGKKADIIIVKIFTKDAAGHALVYNTKGEDVTRVIINGQVIK